MATEVFFWTEPQRQRRPRQCHAPLKPFIVGVLTRNDWTGFARCSGAKPPMAYLQPLCHGQRYSPLIGPFHRHDGSNALLPRNGQERQAVVWHGQTCAAAEVRIVAIGVKPFVPPDPFDVFPTHQMLIGCLLFGFAHPAVPRAINPLAQPTLSWGIFVGGRRQFWGAGTSGRQWRQPCRCRRQHGRRGHAAVPECHVDPNGRRRTTCFGCGRALPRRCQVSAGSREQPGPWFVASVNAVGRGRFLRRKGGRRARVARCK